MTTRGDATCMGDRWAVLGYARMGMPAQFSNAGAPLEAPLPTYLLRRALVRAAAERRAQPFVRAALCAAADRCEAVRRPDRASYQCNVTPN
jgi:hypothetical protein